MFLHGEAVDTGQDVRRGPVGGTGESDPVHTVKAYLRDGYILQDLCVEGLDELLNISCLH